MKILFFSYTFAPNVGGIESVSAILAEKFAEAGHEVELVTETANKENARRHKTFRDRSVPSETAGNEFADRCVTTPPRGLPAPDGAEVICLRYIEERAGRGNAVTVVSRTCVFHRRVSQGSAMPLGA